MTARSEMTFSQYCARLLAQERRDVRQAFNECVGAANERRPEAGITRFVEYLDDQRNSLIRGIADDGVDKSFRLLRIVDDHASSVESLLRNSAGLPASLLTLMRAAGEAALLLCYMHDTDIEPPATVARLAAYQLDSFEGGERTGKSFGEYFPEADESRITEAMQGAQRMFDDAGFVRGHARNPRYSAYIEWQGKRANLKFDATAAYMRYMPGNAYDWSVASGAVHAKGWALPSLTDGIEETGIAAEEQTYVSTTAAFFSIADALTRAMENHSGADLTWLKKATHTRRIGLLHRHGRSAGLHADHVAYASRGTERSTSYLGKSFRRPGATLQ
jgi:hypothetical protein